MLSLCNVNFFSTHIYYGYPCGWFNRASPKHKKIAEELREHCNKLFGSESSCSVSKMDDEIIHPHTQPMFTIDIHSDIFLKVFKELVFNRNGLSILIHPNCGDIEREFTDLAIWLGNKIPIDLS